ncbi:MAG TPA: hypothetical protein VFP50_18940 [Anaeromyxobacteraceae bacterium]|nr:hypothetical protein [Anaeromyxobacteraceae bacterium]
MSQLYETIQRIEYVIGRRNLPGFKTKGLIALRAGFSLALVDASTPDDPAKLAILKRAAQDVLGENV